jgi:hypothetical protein
MTISGDSFGLGTCHIFGRLLNRVKNPLPQTSSLQNWKSKMVVFHTVTGVQQKFTLLIGSNSREDAVHPTREGPLVHTSKVWLGQTHSRSDEYKNFLNELRLYGRCDCFPHDDFTRHFSGLGTPQL